MKFIISIFALTTIFGCGNRIKKDDVPIDIYEKNKMEISKGFQIQQPDIFIPWGINEKTLEDLFKGQNIKRITDGYYTIECTSLNGLNCMLGFHFNPNQNGMLNELEFFRMSYENPKKSFDEFQEYFTKHFGTPTAVSQGSEGHNDYEWTIEDIQIMHYVYNRFGPEEHMSIIKN